MVAPFLQHLAVVGDFVLPFLGGNEIVGVDVLKPDEYPANTGFRRLLDEIRDLVTERIDLDGKSDVRTAFRPQLDQAVEQQLPMAIAGEVVVGDEESLDVLGIVFADGLFEIIRRAEAALATLNVDDRAERALVRTAAAEVDARKRSCRPPQVLLWQYRGWLSLQVGKLVHEIV